MRQILDGIWMWSWLSPPHGYDFNGHLFKLPGLTLVVDPVTAEPPIVEELCLPENAPQRIILTNRNHSRISNQLRERTGARIAIHPADAAHARAQGTIIEDELQLGEHIGPLVVVSAAGKSKGEIALHWPERRLLIVGDALIGDPPGQVRLLRPQVIDDIEQLKKSIQNLLALNFDTLLVGDGVPILSGAHAAVEKLVATF